jgi:polysaccharide deacetylase family protein (PEP-CTERM system associated)
MIGHHFTIDVEEYFHPSALAPQYPMSSWDALERRSPRVMAKMIDFLAQHRVRATCFIVGWLAEREPEMVRAIADAGHEVASHGWEHELVGRLGPERFRESVRRSKQVLEDTTGQRVSGYRAPSFSIVPGLEWAFDVLLEEGFTYDASLFPVRRHPTYGYPAADRYPHRIHRDLGSLVEIPSTTLRVLGGTLPASGGAYFRMLPYSLTRAALRQAAASGRPGTFYIHPWELDDWQPTVAAPKLQLIRTFGGRRGIWARMARLLREFEFGAVADTVAAMVAAGRGA